MKRRKSEEKSKETFKEKLEALKLAISWTYKSSKWLTILIFSIVILGGLLTIIEPYVFRVIIDIIVGESEISLAQQLGIGLVGILVVYGVARVLQSVLWDMQSIIKRIHSQKLDQYVTKTLMGKISSLDAVYFEDPKYYDTVQKANDSLWRVNEFFWQFTFFLGQLISVLVIVGALFTFNWIIVALIAGAVFPSIIFAFKSSEISWSAFDLYSPISRRAHYYRNMMINDPQAIKEIKLFGLKSHFIGRFESLLGKFIKKQEKAARKEIGLFVLAGMIEGVLAVIAAWLVIKSFIDGEITIGQVTFFWALLFQFAEHARYMVRMIGELNSSVTFITPFVKILSFEPKVKEAKNPKDFPKKLKQGIEFRNVTFYYPKAKRPALRNFNLHIKPGESIALVGENGSGKTTMVKLLTRLYDVSEGEILIDGTNIKEYSLDSLYENIGVIFQDFMKYEALVEENIGYGKLKKIGKRSDIHEASVKSGAWDFVKSLTRKYKTHVGKTLEEKGVELSVGQWQKIALARAFFKDAQILCLDEPTAAVDAKAEYKLFKKFEKLAGGKSTILISHRFSTVRMADKIVLIEGGRIVEKGTHRELLRKNGKYSKLFKLQAEGYRDYFEGSVDSL